MKSQTASVVIGIGIASILAGIYAAVRSSEIIDGLSGVFIGVALIGTVLIERKKNESREE